MQHSFFVTATGTGTGLTSVCLGLVRALEQRGVKVAFCKPIAQTQAREDGPERSTHLVKATLGLEPAQPLTLGYAQQQLAEDRTDALMEEVIHVYQQSAGDADVVIVEGLVPVADESYIGKLNVNLARALDADVILVGARNDDDWSTLAERIRMTASLFGGTRNDRVLGCILNKVGAPSEESQQVLAGEDPPEPASAADVRVTARSLNVFNDQFLCLGTILWDPLLVAPRALDIQRHLQADLLYEGQLAERRVQTITVCARTMRNMLHTLRAGTLVVTPGDREDILLASCMAALNGVPLSGLVFTGGIQPDPAVLELCQAAFKTGLPVMQVPTNTFTTAQQLNALNTEVPTDDIERMEAVMNAVAGDLESDWLLERTRLDMEKRLSPPAFRHRLVQQARAANKRIVLPEGEEPRTVQAAVQCHRKGMARCVLLGRPEEVQRVAASQNLTLPDDLEIIDPEAVREHYIAPMVELRKHKGLSEPMAEAQLEDTVVLATMMLAQDEVDGLVSGAVHTTANTIRPALQLIKTKPDAALVSSVFFMLLPDQAVVYGDCAVNPDPNASELADIAIQSGDSARAFGIEPRIAMISYSTGESGAGSDVEKVREATKLAQQKRPDLLIDGPLQYDAASTPSVAKGKAPNSKVAGRANVFVFPDLNTGNTTYKAVQRSANVVSIGPMLQGLRKPVNDLSRGAGVEDIIYTIALTAVQAAQNPE
ncbi:phosphate acetyltransferase [Saccharospirillum sp. MSK14-1]|uniref:phosphate acetyltransferase n=1 Tax=Saccharospirillum sp. MSK14-1 TaxID=1897632 RepID=UPI000D3D9C94|nr:phosphate acetyltransferase [Saccharospirillum sp. MSK14-1]PTY36996.1 phosphate acetyltransferase [Saccharospirillum sp. MSK14-1]